ncbi:hypothetical protein, partial [Crenobacter caeni]|uniref:hypothetical protein n=1 Tax=Crenobacter caeni TaxID=2705474 RepID=UPI00193FF10D
AASVQSEPGSNSSVQSLTFSYFWHASPKKLSFPSLAVQVLAAPSTHTYRLFVLLKSSDVSRCVRCVEVANYTFAARLRQHPPTQKPQQNRHATDFIAHFR